MGNVDYKWSSASETAEWIKGIVEFLMSYSFFTEAHLVNFFDQRLWESLDQEWVECLRKEPVEVLVQIPSGLVKDDWPPSLRRFLLTLNSLLCPRQPNLPNLQSVLPPGFNVISLDNNTDTHTHHRRKKKSVIRQGMNPKKKHEVEILSAVVSSIANSLGPHTTIFDVGAGQGYLSQLLSFEYHHSSVVAIDASSHHGTVTDARARRIHKHYSQFAKSNTPINLPKTITSRVISVDVLKHLVSTTIKHDHNHNHNHNVVLAGLHACGDLSVIMLRTFLDSPHVQAVVSLGCCYNLLTEHGLDHVDPPHGFPLSHTVQSSAFSLGKTLRDLACQSAERWRCLQTDDGIHNFDLHAFRAAFQTLLKEYYPEIMITSPSIGRQGKALRRLQKRETRMESNCPPIKSTEPETGDSSRSGSKFHVSHKGSEFDSIKSADKYSLFQRYSESGLSRLGLEPLQDIDFCRIWDEVEPFSELIGPYWSLRAALGPLLETFILLDRLLFLQEAGNSIETMMLPIFDPELSPRNVAIIAKKK